VSAKGFETFLPTYDSFHKWKDRTKKISEALFPDICLCRRYRAQLHGNDYTGCARLSRSQARSNHPRSTNRSIRKCVSDVGKVEPHPYLREGMWFECQNGRFPVWKNPVRKKTRAGSWCPWTFWEGAGGGGD